MTRSVGRPTKTVYVYDSNNVLLRTHASTGSAADAEGMDISTMSRYCNGHVVSPHFRYSYTAPVPVKNDKKAQLMKMFEQIVEILCQ
jgi:hypothetical protein